MLNNKTVAVVVPAYNEESQIKMVIDTMPDYVDRIIVVNDCSTDATSEVVKSITSKEEKRPLPVYEDKSSINSKRYNRAEEIVDEINRKEIQFFPESNIVNTAEDDRVVLIELLKNSGVGAAIARGYKWCKDNNIDCTAVMAGDGQMDPDELESICMPVIKEEIDYVKGNRLIHPSASILIPKTRFLGNSVLSILTKIASGYWHISDTQTGFTAISKSALNSIKIYDIYPSYGMPNDLLVKLNIAFCTLREVKIKPIYNVGEQSKMKIFKLIPRVSWLLLKSFYKRLWQKYLLRSFHPLFILYHLSFLLMIFALPFGLKILSRIFTHQDANPVTVIAFSILFIGGFQSLLFAMWMDIQDNERLQK